MEQKRIISMPTGLCEKFFRALNAIFRPMHHISDRPQFPAVDPAAKPQKKTKLDALQQPNSVVPVIFESPVFHPPPNQIEKPAASVLAKPNGEMGGQENKVAEMPVPGKVVADLKNGQGANATPKDEAKAPNFSNQGKPATRGNPKEQGNRTIPNSGDRFTDFINRTMINIRATSDVGKHSSGLDGAKIKTKTSSKSERA